MDIPHLLQLNQFILDELHAFQDFRSAHEQNKSKYENSKYFFRDNKLLHIHTHTKHHRHNILKPLERNHGKCISILNLWTVILVNQGRCGSLRTNGPWSRMSVVCEFSAYRSRAALKCARNVLRCPEATFSVTPLEEMKRSHVLLLLPLLTLLKKGKEIGLKRKPKSKDPPLNKWGRQTTTRKG